MLKFVYGIFPAFVSYKEVDGKVKNFAKGCRIVIQPKYKDDKGLLKHELAHVKQWYRGGLLIHTLRYKRSRRYRLYCEVEAYKEQMKYGMSIEDIALKLTWDRYRLGLTYDQALLALLEFVT